MAARSSWSSISRTNQNAAFSSAAPPTTTTPVNYSEVFGRLRGKGVPVLEVPLLDQGGEKEQPFDLSPADYSEVFGGYDDTDFAPSYEELFGKSMSEEEACWTQSALEKSCNYIRSSERSGTGGVGCGNIFSKEIEFDTEASDVKPKDLMSQNDSQSNGPFVAISGIGRRTHSSKCPPPLRQPPCVAVQNEDLYCLNGKSRGGRSKSYSFHGTESLLSFHDVEVDASSSAAAMLDVMEKAQAKLDSAKDIMEQKNEGLLYRLKSCQKKSCKRGDMDVDGSSKLKQNSVRKVSDVESVGSGQQNINIAAETVSRSREEKKRNSAVRKPGSLSCRDFENSVRVNGVADAVVLLDMAKNGGAKRLVKAGRSGMNSKIIGTVRKCDGEKEVQCCEASSEHKIAESEGENKVKPDFGTANTENKHMKIEARSTEQIYQGPKEMSHKVVDIRFGLTEETCIGEQNLNTEMFACDPVEDFECLKEPYESNIFTENSQAFLDWWGCEKATSASEQVLEELQSENDNTRTNGSIAKLCASEDHCMGGRAVFVEPFRSSCDLKENWIFEMSHLARGRADRDPDDEVVRSELDLETKPGFIEDEFESQSLEKIGSVSGPTFAEKNVVQDEWMYEKIKPVLEIAVRTLDLGDDDQNMSAATTELHASQKILIHPRIFSESDGLEERATAELGENEMLSNKAQVPAMRNDRQKLPKTVDLEAEIFQKSRPASENSFTSDDSVKDLMLASDEKSRQELLKKLEKERGREREKDRLVVGIALHEVHEKAHNAIKTAVERGTRTIEHQQSTIKPEELQGESPQRCKARLERQRRTAQRAAMALAEKNARDLAAQRELAERNRFADSLVAEVKRWATGKEGNLRALLSTLQYILGADSGWKATPLTEVITPVGVKKAYRKAMLYVHPDKVQQRGANAQQKFVCEKVFDLLKDAWNKFNSEGR